VILSNKKLRLTTVSIINHLSDIELSLLEYMDLFIFFRERDKDKSQQAVKTIWEKRFKKLSTYEKFSILIDENLGPMKAVIACKEGLYGVKLGKGTKAVITPICSF
jgi:hypothetical protein